MRANKKVYLFIYLFFGREICVSRMAQETAESIFCYQKLTITRFDLTENFLFQHTSTGISADLLSVFSRESVVSRKSRRAGGSGFACRSRLSWLTLVGKTRSNETRVFKVGLPLWEKFPSSMKIFAVCFVKMLLKRTFMNFLSRKHATLQTLTCFSFSSCQPQHRICFSLWWMFTLYFLVLFWANVTGIWRCFIKMG